MMQTNLIAQANLTDKPTLVNLVPAIYLYVQKNGLFVKKAPLAWKEFWSIASKIDQIEIIAMLGLSRIDENTIGNDAFIYQAGITLRTKPEIIPTGLYIREIQGGLYARFLLKGSYSQLPAAYPVIFSIIRQLKLEMRNDFCIEEILKGPGDTTEDKMETALYIPVME